MMWNHRAEFLLELSVGKRYCAFQIRVDVVMRFASIICSVVFLYKFCSVSDYFQIHAQWLAYHFISEEQCKFAERLAVHV